jgi:predicted nucleotidyltransferase
MRGNTSTTDRIDIGRLVDIGSRVASRYAGVHTAFIGGSLLEGFGNPTSDLDVFVVTDGTEEAAADPESTDYVMDDFTISVGYQGDVRTDTEVWSLNVITDIADRLSRTDLSDWNNATEIDPDWLQFAHKIQTGAAVSGEAAFGRIRAMFPPATLCAINWARFMAAYNGTSEDAIGAIIAADAGTAMFASRAALGAATDALLAALGSTNDKPKWRFRKIQTYGDPALLARYLHAELDSSPDPAELLAAAKRRLRIANEFATRAQQLIREVDQAHQGRRP